MENRGAPNEQSNPRPDPAHYKALDSAVEDEFDLDIRLELPGYASGSDPLVLAFPTNTCISCGGCTGHSCAPTSCCGSGTCLPTCQNCTGGGSCNPTSCCGTGGGSCNPTSCCTITLTCGNCTPGCGHHTDQATCGGNCTVEANCHP
jgi:hypothetical protein